MFARKYRIHAALILLFAVIIIVPQYFNKPDKHKVEAAAAAAVEFLELVDAGQYADSWLIAAPYLQEKIDQDKWQQSLTEMRADLGELVGRNLDKSNFTAAIKEMPDSELLLLEYASSFKNRVVEEVVTVIYDKKSRWRVIGYRLQ